MTSSQTLAVLATIVSAVFFVGGKVLLARYRMPWMELWRWSLVTSGVCGLICYAALGAPAVSWGLCLTAGCAGALAHIAANQAMSWGDATLLVPISGAKPIVLIPLLPLVLHREMPSDVTVACLVATLGVALTGLAPRRVHLHAPRPTAAFALMGFSLVLMGLSDVYGAKATEAAGPSLRYASIALWTATLGVIPGLTWVALAIREARRPAAERRAPPPNAVANRLRAVGLGVIFAVFIALLALAFTVAADPRLAVAEVSVVVAFRGVVAVLLVLALDRWFATGLEPLPWWVHALRLSGAVVLGVAVVLTYW
jgi:drug/metabolite transporter (DMT)-like permease